MNEIWANRLVAGTRTWAEMPASRQIPVMLILGQRVESGAITAEQYKAVTGEEYEA